MDGEGDEATRRSLESGVGGWDSAKGTKKAFDRFDHGTLEIEGRGDDGRASNRFGEQETGRAAPTKLRVATSQQVVANAASPDDEGPRMRPTHPISCDQDLAAASFGRRGFDSSNCRFEGGW